MLGQAMIQRDQLELLLAALAGAGLGGITGIVLGREELGTLIWALIGAVVVSGVVYFHRSLRR
jgi:outer membrane lipoprotein SlyB